MEPPLPNLKIKEIKWFRQKDDGMVGRVEDPDQMALIEVGGVTAPKCTTWTTWRSPSTPGGAWTSKSPAGRSKGTRLPPASCRPVCLPIDWEHIIVWF